METLKQEMVLIRVTSQLMNLQLQSLLIDRIKELHASDPRL